MNTLITALLVGIAWQPIDAQTVQTRHQLIAARDTVWRAFFRNDTALLRRFLPPSTTSVEGHPDARWSDRRRILEDSRRMVDARARLVDLSFANTHIAQSGQSALVRSNYQTVVESNGKRDTTRGQATELFARMAGTWVNPYWQLEPASSSNDVGREISLPDTLGANFAIADSAAKRGTMADYDALIGSWEFRFQNRRPDDTYEPSFTGHWTFEKKPGGALIEDRWRPDSPSTPMGLGLYTYRTFDHERRVWQMMGSWSEGGEVQPGLTWSDDTHRYAIQRGDNGLTRIRYLSIDADHFFWRADRSTDGGRTWLRDSAIMEATRVGR